MELALGDGSISAQREVTICEEYVCLPVPQGIWQSK
jgi:hypothetical protein